MEGGPISLEYQIYPPAIETLVTGKGEGAIWDDGFAIFDLR